MYCNTEQNQLISAVVADICAILLQTQKVSDSDNKLINLEHQWPTHTFNDKIVKNKDFQVQIMHGRYPLSYLFYRISLTE